MSSFKKCVHCGHLRDRHIGTEYGCWNGSKILPTNFSSGSFSRNLSIPADLMPYKAEIKKSTVILLVAGKPWNELVTKPAQSIKP